MHAPNVQLGIIHDVLWVTAVLLRGKRGRREIRCPGAPQRVYARKRRCRRVDGEELCGGRGTIPAAPHEEKGTECDEAEKDDGTNYAACNGARVGVGGGGGVAAVGVG